MKRFPSFFFVIAGALLFFCSQPEKPSHDKQVTFRVLPRSLADTARVYITGNEAQLGAWHPGRVALAPQADGSWSRTFNFPKGARLEYKFTRGSWENEAASAEGLVPPNFVLQVNNDTVVVLHIASWRDLAPRAAAKITGAVKYHRQMASPGLKPRDVIVWLPPGYETSRARRYPVLYMHDGQNVFDPSTSFLGTDWQVDETADSLMRAGQMEEIIIVGIYNTSDRTAEYSDTDRGRSYMKFLVETLKPFIDANYRTRPGREHTATMGSSMGGLISFLLAWEHAPVFSQAACLSPAFIPPFDGIVRMVENDHGPARGIRIYMDNGGVALDSVLQAGCEAMLAALQKNGFKPGDNLEWFHDVKAEHTERAWAARVWRPLLFMFGRANAKKSAANLGRNL